MAMTRRLWSISAAAVELCRDRRTIAGVLKDVPPDGDIDARTKGWWLRTILDAMAPQAADGDLNFEVERARKTKEEADHIEMKNAQLRRELLARGDVDAAVTGAFARVRARLLAVPSKVAAEAASVTDPLAAEDLIEGAVHEALAELASTDIEQLCADD